MKNLHLPVILIALLAIACSPATELTNHSVGYEVTPQHPDAKVQSYLDNQDFYFSIKFQSDSFFANYILGETALVHLSFGKDSALLAAKFVNGKFKAPLSRSEIDKYLEVRASFEIQKQSEKQQIDSLKCKKALLIYPDGSTGEVWYTSSFIPKNKLYEYGFSALDGLPVKFTVKEEDVTYSFRLVELSKIKQTKDFSFATENYQVVSLEELLNRGIKP